MFRISLLLAFLAVPKFGYTQPDLPQKSLVAVSVTVGNTVFTGRGVVIAPKIVATAHHVIEDNGHSYLPEIGFSNGTKVRSTEIIKTWKERDLAIVRVSVPDEIPVIELSDDPEPAEAWSYDLSLNRKSYRYCITNDGSNYFDYTPRSGESGGPVFSGNRLVGIVSGGHIWLKEKRNHTWPLRAGRIEVLREYGTTAKAN